MGNVAIVKGDPEQIHGWGTDGVASMSLVRMGY